MLCGLLEMMKRNWIAACAAALLWSPMTPAQTPTRSMVGTVSAFKTETTEIEIKPDSGAPVAFKVTADTMAQRVAPGVTDPTNWDITSTPPLVSGSGFGRAVPDLSADADPVSGYLLYEPSFAGIGQPTLQGSWGGTSFVAPQFNGSTAVIDSYLGHRVGLWNPNLYAFAAGPNSPVTPLNQLGTGNDNLFFTGNPGERYNPATGLGVPDLTKFTRDLAAAW